MKFTTKNGLQYAVDMKTRELASWAPDVPPLKFRYLTGLYMGSTSVRFKDDERHDLLHIVDEIVSIQGSPLEFAEPEPGNILFTTKNSAYEIDQEQKQFRRLGGLNPVSTPDGEWVQYTHIQGLKVGQRALLFPVSRPDDPLVTSPVREIKGTFVEPPTDPGLLSVSVAMVKAEIPRQPL
jgi:hypothetical protein